MTVARPAAKAESSSAACWEQVQRLECLGRLALGVSHEFNNALTVIAGCAEMLAARCDLGSAREMTELRRAVDRASALARQLLIFGRPSAGPPPLLDLGGLLRRMESALACVTRSRIALRLDTGPAVCLIRAQPAEVEQIVLNLVINACDAIRGSAGVVQVMAATVEVAGEIVHRHGRLGPGRYVRLTVGDNGSGMDEDTLRRLFEPFFSTKAPGQGTGLGLTMIRDVVERAGGQVMVQSTLGLGTCVEVYWPG